MRDVVAEVVVERQRDGERITATAGGDGGRKVPQLHKLVVAPQMGKLTREPCPGDRRDELAARVSVSIPDVVVHQDKPGPAIRGPQKAEQRTPHQRLERGANPRAEPTCSIAHPGRPNIDILVGESRDRHRRSLARQ